MSSDTMDMVQVSCKLCDKKPQLSRMRSHTKNVHGMAIADYKEKFTVNILERIYHRSYNPIFSNLI